MIFIDYDKDEFKEYLEVAKPADGAKVILEKLKLKNLTNEEVDSERIRYLEQHDYKLRVSYGVSKQPANNTENKYIVITKHRDWKDQDRPFWIPIELAEQFIKDLQEAVDFYKNNR